MSIAKNYLSQDELQALERIVSMYLDYAEYQAGRHIPMTMEDWAKRLDRFLEFNEHESDFDCFLELAEDAGKLK